MIITISGTPGSGKSTIAKILQEKLKAERIYVGGIRRELARKKNMTLQELNAYALTHPETDREVDAQAAAEARKILAAGKKVIVEGRTQYYFLPESVKIFVKVNPQEGARRIWKDLQQQRTREQRNEAEVHSLEELEMELERRQENDRERYWKYYRIDPTQESQYDLVMDTTAITAEQAAGTIFEFLKKAYKEGGKG